MPSQFQKQFKEVGFPTLLTEFGESILYVFVGGGSRSINAIIERNPPATWDAAGNVVLPEYTIRVLSDCKLGVLPSEVNTGGDEVEIIDEIGNSKPVRKTVMMKIREGTGVVELALK